MTLQILLVRHGVTDENRAHSLGAKQEYDPVLSERERERFVDKKGASHARSGAARQLTVEASGLDQVDQCGDALVGYLFDGALNSPKKQQMEYDWAQFQEKANARREQRPARRQTLLRPLGLEPKDVQVMTSIFPRARQTTQRILQRFKLAGFSLRHDQWRESATIIEVDMPFKRLNNEGREALKILGKRREGTQEGQNIQTLFSKNPPPAILMDRYPYAPTLDEIQESMRDDLQQFVTQCHKDGTKVGVIVAHAVTLQAIRGLLCGIDGRSLEHTKLQGNASVLAVDLPEGIGSGQVLGYVHGREYRRDDSPPL